MWLIPLILMLTPDQFTVSVEQQKSFTVTVQQQQAKPKRREWYLVSEPWCSHCPRAKKIFLDKGWPPENILTIAECERRFRFRPDHVPFEFGDPSWQQALTTKMKTTGTAVRTTTRTVTRMSHGAMVGLHNRLHGGGSWTWPGDLASHLRQAHGVRVDR